MDEQLLQQIRDQLGKLPAELAVILGKNPASKVPGGDGEGKPARLWEATERLGFAAGKFFGPAGEAAGAMRGARELSEAGSDWMKSFREWRNPKKKPPPDSGDGQFPPPMPDGTPSAPVKSLPGSGSSGLAAGAGPGSTGGLDANTKALAELTRAVDRLRESMDQNDPEPAEDAEQKSSYQRQESMWQPMIPAPQSKQDSDRADSSPMSNPRPTGPLRPEQKDDGYNVLGADANINLGPLKGKIGLGI